MFLSLNDVYCCTTLQGALQWKIIKSFSFLHRRIEAMCSIDMSYPTFQTVFLTLPSFLPIDKISLHSLAFNPHFTCLPAHKPELISKVYPSSLCVCVFVLSRLGEELCSGVRVCAHVSSSSSSSLHITDSPCRHDIVPLPGAPGLRGVCVCIAEAVLSLMSPPRGLSLTLSAL